MRLVLSANESVEVQFPDGQILTVEIKPKAKPEAKAKAVEAVAPAAPEAPAATETGPTVKAKRTMSPEARKKISEAAKRRWAKTKAVK